MHQENSPLARTTVKVKFAGEGHPQIPGSKDQIYEYEVEGYWDFLTGKSWGESDGNPAALVYAMRAGMSGLPWNDEVLYGKIGKFGHLVHVSEIVEETNGA